MAATELLDAPKTEIAKPQPINWDLLREQALASFDIQSEEIAKEVEADTQLVVTDDNTRKAAKERKLVWVRRRTSLDRTRKAASADAQSIVKLVKEVAENFQTEFDKAEQHLAEQIDVWDEKIEKEKQAKLDAVFNARNAQLLHVGLVLDRIVIDSMSDADIERRINDQVELNALRKAQAEKAAADKAEADRIEAARVEANRVEAERLEAERAKFEQDKAAEKAERVRLAKIESDKLEAQKADFARQQAEVAAERERQATIEANNLAAERAEIARVKAEQAEAQRKLDEAKAAAEKVETDRIAKIERERLAAEQKERDRIAAEQSAAAEVERKKQIAEQEDRDRNHAETMRPWREKMVSIADAVDAVSQQLMELELPAEFDYPRGRMFVMIVNVATECRKLIGAD